MRLSYNNSVFSQRLLQIYCLLCCTWRTILAGTRVGSSKSKALDLGSFHPSCFCLWSEWHLRHFLPMGEEKPDTLDFVKDFQEYLSQQTQHVNMISGSVSGVKEVDELPA
ncbi:hypothetical protein AMECASPLE_010134, partial [Ameca splendens]